MRHLSNLSSIGLALIALLLCASYIPGHWVTSFLAGMRLHIIALLLFACLFSLVFHRNWLLASLVILALLSLGHSMLVVRDLTARTVAPSEGREAASRLRLISFNMLGGNERGADIADMLLRSDADIVVGLESQPLWDDLPRIREVFPHQVGCVESRRHCDLAVFSRLPLKNVQMRSIGPNRRHSRFITAQVDLGEHSVQLVAIHLTKPFFGSIHQEELRDAAAALAGIKGPFILAGDFNSGILATDVQDFMGALGLRVIGWEPNTWPVFAPAIGLPIDHIMISDPLAFERLERLPDAIGSNHFGLVSDIRIAPMH